MNMVKRCTRCILPEGFPGITFDGKGICSYCNRHEQLWGEWKRGEELQAKSQTKLLQIFDWAKSKKKKYDALVAISGGKDSSYALHLCTKVYGLNVLAFTNNHGIRADFADENVSKMVSKLGVDHEITEEPIMLDLYRYLFMKTGHFCSPCELVTFNSNFIVADKYDIPLIVWGSSSRTDAGFPKELNPWNPWYFKKVLKNSEISKRLKSSFFNKNYLLRSVFDRLIGKRKLILLPNYIEWNEQAIMEFLQNEYGLIFHGEHKDCLFTGVAGYLQKKNNPTLDPDTMKYSSWIRNGQMDRETALKLAGNLDNKPPEEFNLFLEKLNLTPEEFENASRLSPAPYLKGLPYIFNRVRRILRKQY